MQINKFKLYVKILIAYYNNDNKKISLQVWFVECTKKIWYSSTLNNFVKLFSVLIIVVGREK